MHKNHKNILIFVLLTIFAVIVLFGAYDDMQKQPGYFADTTYPFIFGGCILALLIFGVYIIKEYRIVEDKLEDLSVKVRVHDMLKEVKSF